MHDWMVWMVGVACVLLYIFCVFVCPGKIRFQSKRETKSTNGNEMPKNAHKWSTVYCTMYMYFVLLHRHIHIDVCIQKQYQKIHACSSAPE